MPSRHVLISCFLMSCLGAGSIGCNPTRTVRTLETSPASTPTPPVNKPENENPKPPQPPIVSVVTYTRLLCGPQVNSSKIEMSSILTNAGASGFPVELSIPNEDSSLQHIDRIELISGSEKKFTFIFSNVAAGKDRVDIYTGEMDLLYKRSSIKKIGSAPYLEGMSKQPLAMESLANFFSFSRLSESLLVPNLEKKQYVIRDSFSPQTLSQVHLSPNDYINPVLSSDAGMALFQKRELHSLHNYAYSLASETAIPFPQEIDTVTQYAPSIYRTGHIVWLERTSKGLWLKMSTWADLKNKKSQTLSQIDEKNLSAIGWGVRQGYLYLAQAYEEINETYPRQTLKNGSLKLTEWNVLDPQETRQSLVGYPTSFYNQSIVGNEKVISKILYSPWNHQWVFATFQGLSTFDLNIQTWQQLGQQNFFRCSNPVLGPEFRVEEVRP